MFPVLKNWKTCTGYECFDNILPGFIVTDLCKNCLRKAPSKVEVISGHDDMKNTTWYRAANWLDPGMIRMKLHYVKYLLQAIIGKSIC